jgi:hypothetical protein
MTMTMTRSEAGRLGGRRTVELHGREHMRAIGRLGFAALARRPGFAGGRRGAPYRLSRDGKLPPAPDLTAGELEDLQHAVGLDDDQPEEGRR